MGAALVVVSMGEESPIVLLSLTDFLAAEAPATGLQTELTGNGVTAVRTTTIGMVDGFGSLGFLGLEPTSGIILIGMIIPRAT